jgi:hypothetical protein
VNQIVRDLVASAAAGHPVYISKVRDTFAGLSAEESFTVTARLGALDGGDWQYRFTLPRFAVLGAEERALATEFLLAGLYNVISTVGGRGLWLTADDRAEPETIETLTATVRREFGIGLARGERPGYGRAVNVAERMAASFGGGSASWGAAGAFGFETDGPAPGSAPTATNSAPAGGPMGILGMCRAAVSALDGRAILGMDVGGTDIKLCLAVDGRAVRFVEYDWFPAAFTRIDELSDPILLLVRLLRLDLASAAVPAIAAAIAPALGHVADTAQLEAAVAAGEAAASGTALPAFDGIGVCFPDVVVRDKIVGGEVYKTRGIRNNPTIDYEAEFQRLSDLDVALRRFVRPGGAVGIVNDGPMAAFTAAVETAATDEAAVADGIFAHTLGTELGTGWVTETGSIPDIPLEIYNCVIDLGSYPERQFEPDDVRSVLNFNTQVAGTLQKYASQSGVFRLAMKYLPAAEPATFEELVANGFLEQRGTGWYVPTAPRDMRKPFLEFMMRLPERGPNAAVERIFRELGEFMAVAWLESRWLLSPAARRRVLFGRVVKHRACFDLMVEGAASLVPGIELTVANEEMANTPLMRQLKQSRDYTVAQFAQAVGAVHYANFRLHADSTVDAHAAVGTR